MIYLMSSSVFNNIIDYAMCLSFVLCVHTTILVVT